MIIISIRHNSFHLPLQMYAEGKIWTVTIKVSNILSVMYYALYLTHTCISPTYPILRTFHINIH